MRPAGSRFTKGSEGELALSAGLAKLLKSPITGKPEAFPSARVCMKTNRREFLTALGSGAIGIGLSTTSPALGEMVKMESTSPRRKMVVRADDIGMSNVCNIGTFEAIKNGVVTVAAVMLADPGTEDALERLRDYPWLSIDWHMHM
jgi:hypothetical protein